MEKKSGPDGQNGRIIDITDKLDARKKENGKPERAKQLLVERAENLADHFPEFRRNFAFLLKYSVDEMENILKQLRHFYDKKNNPVVELDKIGGILANIKNLEREWDVKINQFEEVKIWRHNFETTLADLQSRGIRPDLQEKMKKCLDKIELSNEVFSGTREEILEKFKKFAGEQAKEYFNLSPDERN